MPPWERRPDETSKSYRAFTQYLLLGPDRSLEELRKELDRKPSYLRWLEVWSSKYDWVDRATAYDAEMGKQALEKNKGKVVESLERQAREARAWQQASTAPVLSLLRQYGGIDGVVNALQDEGLPIREQLMLVSQLNRAWGRAIEVELRALGEPERKEALEMTSAEESRRILRRVFDIDPEWGEA